MMSSKTPLILVPALRQYQPNGGGDFLFGFDLEDTIKIVEQLTKELEEIAEAIHYPDCWDTMAYPTLLDAITEINHCSACEAIQLSDCGDKE